MFPLKLSDETISKAENATRLRELATSEREGKKTPQEVEDLTLQKIFLQRLEVTFSTVMAMRAAGISRNILKRWQENYYDFAIKYNEIIDDHAEGLLGSAYQRAVGTYRKCDDDKPTESGLLEDALGNPIVMGGNDKLTLKLLEAFYPEQFGNKKGNTVSDINPLRIILTNDDDDEQGDE